MSKVLSYLMAGLLLTPTALQAAPHGRAPKAPAVSKPAPAHYLIDETVIELLLDDPQANAVVDKHLPGLTTSDYIGLLGGLTLKDLQQFLPQVVTTEKLTAIQADFNSF